MAARQIAHLAERCQMSRAKDDCIHCTVAAWRGSWEPPDNAFADAVETSIANEDAPDLEMPSGTETADIGARRRRAPRNVVCLCPHQLDGFILIKFMDIKNLH
jgi:hypothetical protein